MSFQNGLKAGAIGAAVAVVLTLISQIPFLGGFVAICNCILFPLLWLGVGVLAGYFGNKANPMQTGGEAAQAGAVAGAVAALGSGFIQTIIAIIQLAIGGTAQILSQIPADQLRQLQDAGIDPAIFSGVGGLAAIVGCCCIILPLLAAALGAGGGALSPSIFKRNP